MLTGIIFYARRFTKERYEGEEQRELRKLTPKADSLKEEFLVTYYSHSVKGLYLKLESKYLQRPNAVYFYAQ